MKHERNSTSGVSDVWSNVVFRNGDFPWIAYHMASGQLRCGECKARITLGGNDSDIMTITKFQADHAGCEVPF